MFPNISRKYAHVTVIARLCKLQLSVDYSPIWRTCAAAFSSNTLDSSESRRKRPLGRCCSLCLCSSQNLKHFTTHIRLYTPISTSEHILDRLHRSHTPVSRKYVFSNRSLNRFRVLLRNYSDMKDDKTVKGWLNEIREDFENEHMQEVGVKGVEHAENSGSDSDKSEQSTSQSDHMESSSSESDSSDSDDDATIREKLLHKIMSDAHSAEVLGLTSDELLKMYRLSKESDYEGQETSSVMHVSDIDVEDDGIEVLDRRIADKYMTIDQNVEGNEEESRRLRNVSNNAEINMNNLEDDYGGDIERIKHENISSNAKMNVEHAVEEDQTDTGRIVFDNISSDAETKHDIDTADELDSEGGIQQDHSTDMEDRTATMTDVTDRTVENTQPDWQKVAPVAPEIEIEDFVNLPEEEEVEEAWNPPVPLTRGKSGVYTVEDLVTVLENSNAVDIVMIKIPPNIDFVDYMAIVSAKSFRHMKAIAADVKWIYKAKKYKKDKFVRIEGADKSEDWFAMDLGNIILHIFMPQTREIYDLETLWTVGAEFDEKCKEAADPYVFSVDQLPWLDELESESNDPDNSHS